jgi:hypothetical protein
MLALVVIPVVAFARGIHDLDLAAWHEQCAFHGHPGCIHRDRAQAPADDRGNSGGRGFGPPPFLVIGLISPTTDILTVGAELSLVAGTGRPLGHTMTELTVTAGMVLALSSALVPSGSTQQGSSVPMYAQAYQLSR